MTKIKAGPIPLQNPLTPSVLRIRAIASLADNLTFCVWPLFRTSPVAESVLGTVTAWADWAVWTVQMGFVAMVVIEPGD